MRTLALPYLEVKSEQNQKVRASSLDKKRQKMTIPVLRGSHSGPARDTLDDISFFAARHAPPF